jgi:DNA helicase-2/ATP-dependent DNA helicase PcrA
VDLTVAELVGQAVGQPEEPDRQAGPYLAGLRSLAARFDRDLPGFLSELALGVDADVWDPRADRVSLLTLHAAKGLEFPVVFIVGCEDGIIPIHFGPEDEPDTAEERRLFFVGMTRAQTRLILTHARRRRWRGKVRPSNPSPFLRDIQQQLLAQHDHRLRRKRPPQEHQRLLFDS